MTKCLFLLSKDPFQAAKALKKIPIVAAEQMPIRAFMK